MFSTAENRHLLECAKNVVWKFESIVSESVVGVLQMEHGAISKWCIANSPTVEAIMPYQQKANLWMEANRAFQIRVSLAHACLFIELSSPGEPCK